MNQNTSKIAYFMLELENERTHGALTKERIHKAVIEGPFRLSEQEQGEIIKHLESRLTVTQSRGHSIKGSDYKPWLARRRASIEFYYWNRLKKYYLQRDVLPPSVVSVLDDVTDEVLDFCGDPAQSGQWKRRGMVLGHVQSGKTTNYASLICKAADAGYKVIILLAGITNSLRAQTQERLDETFIGRKSIFQSITSQKMPIINYADKMRWPLYGTSRDQDFSKLGATTYGVELSSVNEPVIFITKKNKSTLSNLRDWIRDQHYGDAIHHPLLLIDDEADNASVNTADDGAQVTAINKVIRELLTEFSRSTYIGYTATPFANIFIDPDSEDAMLEDDLFPSNFIKALDTPSNYVGANRVFGDDGDLRDLMLIEIDDFEEILPLTHKRDIELGDLPVSLYEAVRLFVLSRAVRIVRGDGSEHCSMMVNVSRFNDVQEEVMGLIYSYLDALKNAITVNAGLGAKGESNHHMAALKETFDRHYSSCIDERYEDLRPLLQEAIATIVTRTINMRGGVLDYTASREHGLHVIAVGGLALSRGLTLEGLTVSYILRNVAASDTLMQMARWFGYRPNYEDLCRLFAPPASVDHYEYITEAIEELRSDIKRMQAVDMTPKDFGLRVRQSPAAIRITAANKMRRATKLTVAQNYERSHIEGFVLYNDAAKNEKHRNQLFELVAKLGESTQQGKSAFIWEDVSAKLIFPFLKGFDFPPAHSDLGPVAGSNSLLLDYISDRLDADCKVWDVALPFPSRNGATPPPELKQLRSIREHHNGEIANGFYKVTRKNKVANPGDEKIGLDAQGAERRRPLLILHVFDGALKSNEKGTLNTTGAVVSYSVCLPATAVPVAAREYQVNEVYRKQLVLELEPDDDESLIGGPDYE